MPQFPAVKLHHTAAEADQVRVQSAHGGPNFGMRLEYGHQVIVPLDRAHNFVDDQSELLQCIEVLGSKLGFGK